MTLCSDYVEPPQIIGCLSTAAVPSKAGSTARVAGRLLSAEEPQASDLVAEVLRGEGMDIRTGAKVTEVAHNGAGFDAKAKGKYPVIGVENDSGELMGFGARLVSGYVGDRTGSYWTVTIIGYVLNLFAVPLLALAGAWQFAVVLIIAERMGRGIRAPVRDAMLSMPRARPVSAGGLACIRRWTTAH